MPQGRTMDQTRIVSKLVDAEIGKAAGGAGDGLRIEIPALANFAADTVGAVAASPRRDHTARSLRMRRRTFYSTAVSTIEQRFTSTQFDDASACCCGVRRIVRDHYRRQPVAAGFGEHVGPEARAK